MQFIQLMIIDDREAINATINAVINVIMLNDDESWGRCIY